MWYNKITNDLDELLPCLDYFDQQIETAKKECVIKGNLEKQVAGLPGILEYRFNQLQEVEAILEYMEIQYNKKFRKHYKLFLESYNKALTSRDAEKYASAEEEVTDMEELKNMVALRRNRYLGIMKGIEAKNFMLGHITKLRAAGLEDVTLS
jgi:hypothetical protein